MKYSDVLAAYPGLASARALNLTEADLKAVFQLNYPGEEFEATECLFFPGSAYAVDGVRLIVAYPNGESFLISGDKVYALERD